MLHNCHDMTTFCVLNLLNIPYLCYYNVIYFIYIIIVLYFLEGRDVSMGTGRFKKKIITAVAVSLCSVFAVTAPAALRPVETQAAIFQVKIEPEYRQTMARSMLPLLNKWRAGSTWYYDSSNKKVYLNNLKPLTYDYTLEKHAMQRAAEIAISFDHTRPRGDGKTGISGYMAFAENIAATTNTDGGQAAYALDMFKEENYPYSGQGHRRLMLSVPGNFSNIGIACVYYKGAYYWCQSYGMGSKPNTTVTTALNDKQVMTVDVETSMLTSRAADLSELNDWKATLKKGQTDYLPNVNLSIATSDTWPYPAASVQGVPTWTSSNTNTVTVNSNAGTITAVNSGAANVSMKEPITGASKSKTVSVTDPNAVTGVSLNKSTMALNTGASSTLTATVSPSSAPNKSVTWSSSNTAVATVSSSGVVKGVKAGTATITAKTAVGGKTATCKVTVSDVAVTGVSLNKSSITIAPGKTGTITATVKPDNATNKSVTWSSSNTSIATVNGSGVVTGVKEGEVTITAKAGGKTATCKVTILDTSFTGVKNVNGTYTYVKNGVPDYTFSGAAVSTDGKFRYVKNGVFVSTFTGVAQSTTGNWIFMRNGVFDTSFTGVAQSTTGNWIFVKDGRFTTSYTGVAQSTTGNWIFVKNGRFTTSYTGVAQSTTGNWVFVKNGRFTTSYTGVAQSTTGNWVYVKDGRYNTAFTGVTQSTTGNWLFVKKGRFDPSYTGVAYSQSGSWVFVRDGRYNTSFTGVAQSTTGNWVYVKNGRFDDTYTGIADLVNSTKQYYVAKGRWNQNYNGTFEGHTIKNGVVV